MVGRNPLLQDTATFERPIVAPIGIDDVIVNGVAAIDSGKVTGARAGRVLRHPCNLPATRS